MAMTVKTDSTLAEPSARAKHNDIQPTQSEDVKNADNPIQIRPLTLADREILLEMYRTFEPLGRAQGLPPRVEEARQTWIDRALQQEVNVGAFSAGGDLAGHSFLASSDAGEAELAIFVHQRSRQRGIGTDLLRAVLQTAEQRGLGRIHAVTTSDNIPKLRLLKRCGFRFLQPTYGAEVLVLDLPAPAFT
jgi:RimJ/RimL family protein N-acetyltransferase